jgi:hypothetical protein
MSHKRIKHSIKQIATKDLKTEQGSDELVSSPAMRPYIQFARAVVKPADSRPALETIAALPLEQRYVWRVVSALKWAFADYDSLSVVADRETLPSEDRAKVEELLAHRPAQFCLFLKALLGKERMEQMMASAIANARECPDFLTRSAAPPPAEKP